MEDGSVRAKSSVVLNLRSSGQVLPGMPVSRPMRWTSMVGMDHDSVLRAVRGADRAGRARERSVGRSMVGSDVSFEIDAVRYRGWRCSRSLILYEYGAAQRFIPGHYIDLRRPHFIAIVLLVFFISIRGPSIRSAPEPQFGEPVSSRSPSCSPVAA